MTSPADFTFLHPLRVRWSECDAQGIVFNVNYFLYYDVAMWEWTKALGYATWNEAPEFVTAHAECDFKASAIFDDELRVAVRAARSGNKSFDVATAIFRGGDLLNVGKMTYIYVRRGTKETEPLPQEFIDRASAFEKTPPARS